MEVRGMTTFNNLSKIPRSHLWAIRDSLRPWIGFAYELLQFEVVYAYNSDNSQNMAKFDRPPSAVTPETG